MAFGHLKKQALELQAARAEREAQLREQGISDLQRAEAQYAARCCAVCGTKKKLIYQKVGIDKVIVLCKEHDESKNGTPIKPVSNRRGRRGHRTFAIKSDKSLINLEVTFGNGATPQMIAVTQYVLKEGILTFGTPLRTKRRIGAGKLFAVVNVEEKGKV